MNRKPIDAIRVIHVCDESLAAFAQGPIGTLRLLVIIAATDDIKVLVITLSLIKGGSPSG